VTEQKFKCKIRLAVQLPLIGRDHSIYSFPVTHAKLAGNLNSHFSSVQRRSRHTRKAMKTYYSVLPKMLWRTLRRAVFWIESHKNGLVEVKITIDFQRQRRKNLVSAQCVTCCGGLVFTNFEIPASKFPIVVSSPKYAQLFNFFFMRYRKPSAMVCKHFVFLWQEIPYVQNFFSTLLNIRWHGTGDFKV
jgi:hypothetical protein